MAKVSIDIRFQSKVDRRGPDDCWPWKAGVGRGGYGRFWVDGKNVTAHRFAWEQVNGPMPDGKKGLHSCDNPPCCNPAHIFPGSQLDNMRDKVEKGRQASGDRNGARSRPERLARGERHGSANIDEATVLEILALYRSREWSQRALARKFGVSQYLVWAIVNRKLWRHISG